MREHFPIDYAVWADYWDLLEDHGMNPRVLRIVEGVVRSPVLVLGSGQGLLSQACAADGHEVCSVDTSPAMARAALRRRGVKTTLADACDLRLGRIYATVLVNTGIINERTASAGALPRLSLAVAEHLVLGGHALVAYFRRSTWTDVAEALGVYGRPSANVAFWRADGDLLRAKALLTQTADARESIDELFALHPAVLRRHLLTIRALGERHQLLRGECPDRLLADHSGYYPYPMQGVSEHDLVAAMSDRGLALRSAATVNGGDTRVLDFVRVRA